MDDHFNGWYSTQELIKASASEGVKVSAQQIARWHRSGLLPKPKRDYGTGLRGTVTKYPPGTLQTLLAICRVQTGRTPFDEVSWALWWSGNDRDPSEIRCYMEKVTVDLDSLIAKVRSAVQRGERMRGVPTSVRDSLQHTTVLRGPLGWIRRPLNQGSRDDWPIMVDLMLATVTGELPELTSRQKRVITDALHQGEAYAVTMNDEIGWMPAQDGEAITWFAHFMQRPLSKRLAELSDDDLVLARDEARQLLEFGVTFGEYMAWLFKPNGLGYGFMKKVLEAIFGKPDRQVFLVLLIHAFLNDAEYEGNVDSLHKVYEQWDDISEGQRCLTTLVNEVPGLDSIITPGAMNAAVKSSIRREQLDQRLREFHRTRADEIEAVKGRHPELNWNVASKIEAGREDT